MTNAAQNQADRARLIAVSSRHAGDFLDAVRSSAVGTRLELQTGCTYARTFGRLVCICDEQDWMRQELGTHRLSCHKSAGRHFRLNAVNDLIRLASVSAETAVILEPVSPSRSDGKRPDGLTIVLWTRG